MGYSRKAPNYLERTSPFNPTHIMRMADHVAICVETLRIDNVCSLEKEFIEIICMNR